MKAEFIVAVEQVSTPQSRDQRAFSIPLTEVMLLPLTSQVPPHLHQSQRHMHRSESDGDGERATLGDKSDAARAKERKQIDAYKELESDVIGRIKGHDYSNTTFQLTSTLLSQNPEYYTIWNHRRTLLLSVFARELATPPPTNPDTDPDAAAAATQGLSPPQHQIALLIREDLAFLLPLLKAFPKCYWIWNHRSWLLTTATTHLPAPHAVKFWHGELALIGKMLALDSRNFHGWGYRRTVVGEIERLAGTSLAEEEFEYTTKMVKTNLSNFSAWHYRGVLIPKVLRGRDAGEAERRGVLEKELELITTALYTDPYDQSLWFYHEFLLATLDPGNAAAGGILGECGAEVRAWYFGREVESVREMLEGVEDCKYVYQALLDCSRQYLRLAGPGGEVKVTKEEMRAWLGELRTLDPLREGRWRDLETSLKL